LYFPPPLKEMQQRLSTSPRSSKMFVSSLSCSF
jgi:hypothetical protein